MGLLHKEEPAELPLEFKERVKRQLGDAYGDFLASYGKERAYGLRYNPLKIEKERLIAALAACQIPLEPVEWAKEGFYYPPGSHPGKLPLHEAGAYYIQEPSAMIAVTLLDPKPGERILDLCAAPGGKSTQIAGRMQGEGLLVSNEAMPLRAKVLSRNIERMGIGCALVLNEAPERLAGYFPEFFDRILVDAPCSGEGMFRKDIAARGEWSLSQVDYCALRQRGILAHAVRMLKPGGIFVYSTCTFAPQENEEISAWLLQQYPQLTLCREEHIWPHLQRGEGHYAACFCKEGPLEEDGSMAGGGIGGHRQPGGRRKGKKAKGKDASPEKDGNMQLYLRQLAGFCKETLSEEMAGYLESQVQKGRLAAFGGVLYLLPPGIGSLDGLKAERAGLQLGSCKKGRFEPSHAWAMALRPCDVKQAVELAEPMRYLRGEAVNAKAQKGWVLVTVEGCSAGWAKASQGMLKNHYPKGLRLLK